VVVTVGVTLTLIPLREPGCQVYGLVTLDADACMVTVVPWQMEVWEADIIMVGGKAINTVTIVEDVHPSASVPFTV
jgi:hypothetical protein